MLAKQLIHLAGADAAGLILGARVPIVLTSRADRAEARVASCALAQLFVHRARSVVGEVVGKRWGNGGMTDAILALNAGSSSLKFALYEAGSLAPLCRARPVRPRWSGSVRDLRTAGACRGRAARPALRTRRGRGVAPRRDRARAWTHPAGGGAPGRAWRDATSPRPSASMTRFLAALDRLAPLAPATPAHNLVAIRAVAATWPGLPQVACFDTAFHRTQPRLAQLFAIPRALSDEGLVRYGFHGLSYAHVADLLPDLAGERAEGRVIVAHLGHGRACAP